MRFAQASFLLFPQVLFRGKLSDMAGDTPMQKLSAWLSDFGRALDLVDVTAAMELFEAHRFWRDLLPFT